LPERTPERLVGSIRREGVAPFVGAEACVECAANCLLETLGDQGFEDVKTLNVQRIVRV